MNMYGKNSRKSFKILKLSYKDLLIFLIPCIIFLYYLYIYNPGIMTMDSYTQLHQIATGHFNNWHPFFHTFIEMLCIYVYPSPLSVSLFQITIFSSIWMIICKYFRSEDNNKTFILQIFFTLLISLIPINAIYAITLWKDILYSYCMLFLCFLIKVMLDRNCKLDYKFVIGISLIMAFMTQLRQNGFYVILLFLIILGIYLFIKNKEQKLFISIPVMTIIFMLLIASLNVAYDVEDAEHDAVFSKTSHILADYSLNIELEDSDRNKIYELLPEKDIKENYDIYLQDSISFIANETPFENDKGTYIKMVIDYSLKNPKHFIKYLFKSSAMVWDITRDDDWKGKPYYDVNDKGGNNFFTKYNHTPITAYENASNVNFGTDQFNQLDSFVDFARDNIILDSLFNSPAFYMYLAFIILAFLHILTKSKEYYMVYTPNMINIIIIFFSTPIQDNRYLYGNLLVCYLLVIILIYVLSEEFIKSKSKVSSR